MIKTPKARQLCTKVELDLYKQSLPRAVKTLSAVRLKPKVKRARDLRDKYRKLANQQAREARGKAKPRSGRPASGSVRTQEKQELFAEMLERFQDALRAAPATAAKKVKKTAPGQKRVVRKKASAKRKVAKKASAKKTPARKKAVKKAPAKKKVAKKLASPKPAAKKKVASRKAASRGKVGRTSAKRDASAKAVRFKRSGKLRVQRHTASRTRRKQAKSDARGR